MSPESSCIRFHVTRTFIQAGPFFPCHFARAAAAKKIIWTPRSTAENSRGDVDLTVWVFYSENKAEHFMWIVSLEDDSHVTPRLIYAGK